MSQASSSKSGFHGTIGSMPLVDLLQVWSMNGFSGQVVISSHARTGQLYYVEGAVVHAECEDVVGESAVHRIVAWQTGAFELHPNTVTLHRTIEKSLSLLLLEAHQHMDEQRRGAPTAPEPTPAAAEPVAATQPTRPAVLDQVRAIRGVTQVVRFGKDGRPAADAGPAGEALAAKGLYVFLVHAAAAAEAFGLHELTYATIRGERESFVLVHAGGQFLAVAVAQDAQIDHVAGQLRTLLSRPRAS